MHELSSKDFKGKKLLEYQHNLGDSMKEHSDVHKMFITNAFNAKVNDTRNESSNKCKKVSQKTNELDKKISERNSMSKTKLGDYFRFY
jgi:hypothetical protein